MKIHEQGKNRIVAVCDKELIGKVLEKGDIHLDLEKHRGFYVGEGAEKDEVEKALSEFSSANIVGKKAVGIAVSMGLVQEGDIIYINETPHIQIYKI
jgi:hypothetical protein